MPEMEGQELITLLQQHIYSHDDLQEINHA